MNRGNNRRRKKKKKVTGRFFAFLAVLIVLIVMVVFFISSRNNQPTPQTAANPPAESQQPSADAAAGGEDVNDEWANADQDEDDSLLSEDDLNSIAVANSVTISESDLSLNTNLSSEWLNILLLGSDTRNMSKSSRTDTIMIASINTTTGQIKLTSLMRDMWIEIPERGGSDKINSLAYIGGPTLAMKRINEMFGLNIQKYAMVNFLGMEEAIDALGGVKMDITEDEMTAINKTLISQLKSTTDMKQEDWFRDRETYVLSTFGKDTQLTGLQAVAFARIRAIGNGDQDRTNRQQKVMNALLKQVAESVNVGQLARLVPILLESIETNYNWMEIVQIATPLITNGLNTDIQTHRVPENGTYKLESRGGTSALFDVDIEKNKTSLYNFIYG